MDDPYHRAHYRYAYDTFPDLVFGVDGLRFVRQILSENGQYVLSQLWGVMNVKILAERSAFEVRQRTTESGDVQVVFNLPTVGSPLEAHFIGVHVPGDLLAASRDDHASAGSHEGSVRVLYLQEGSHGLTRVVESEGRGGYLDQGDGPDPSWSGMWQVMDGLVTGRF